MSLKYCVYKDCHNYYNVTEKSYSKDNLTFFQFPKDSQRRQKWLQLGNAQPNLPGSFYYYCSDHFDNRYMSRRNRRTVLVGEAVPYAHETTIVSDEADEVIADEYVKDELTSEYYLYEDYRDEESCTTDLAIHQDQDLQVESTTTIDDDIIQLVRSAIDSDNDHLLTNEKSSSESNSLKKCAFKRKPPSAVSPASSSSSNAKISKVVTLTQPSKVNNCEILKKNVLILSSVSNDSAKSDSPHPSLDITDYSKKESFVPNNEKSYSHQEEVLSENEVNEKHDIDLESLVDSKHATVFIFKGEEYVQMPKDYYIKEKLELMKKLQKMENVIRNIKNQLTTL